MDPHASDDISEDDVVERTHAFMEASLPFVDGDSLNESDLQRYVLCLYAFGTVHAFVEAAHLNQTQVESVFQALMRRLFDWPEDMLSGVTQMMIEATADEETRELIETGAESLAAFENGEEEAVESLAALLEECDEDGDGDEEGDFEGDDDEEEAYEGDDAEFEEPGEEKP